MRRWWLLVSTICGTLPAAALGQGLPATTLYAACDGASPVNRSICSFYILGVADGVVQQARRAKDTPAPYCLPDGITGDQLVTAMVTRMRAEPRPSELAAEQVRRHLATAFPCP